MLILLPFLSATSCILRLPLTQAQTKHYQWLSRNLADNEFSSENKADIFQFSVWTKRRKHLLWSERQPSWDISSDAQRASSHGWVQCTELFGRLCRPGMWAASRGESNCALQDPPAHLSHAESACWLLGLLLHPVKLGHEGWTTSTSALQYAPWLGGISLALNKKCIIQGEWKGRKGDGGTKISALFIKLDQPREVWAYRGWKDL